MASIAQKFYELMGIKRNKLIADYEKKFYETYPFLLKGCSQEKYEECKEQFGRNNIDLKVDFYSFDCQYRMLNLILEKVDYMLFFDLLVAFENLSWLEKLIKEFECNAQESKVIIKLFLKHIIPFYIEDNVRKYNLSMEARKNAELAYNKGISSSLVRTINLLQNPLLDKATPDYLEKRNVCLKLNEICKKNKIDAIFSHPELLIKFGLSEDLLDYICDKDNKSSKEINVPYKKVEVNSVISDLKIDDIKITEERMTKYLVNDEPVKIIEGEDFKKFLDLARKLYTPEKVELLKEKVVLNNKKIKSQKRERIKSRIIHEEDRAYYEYLVSIDITDPYFLPYASYIQSTISLIEEYIIDLMNVYSDDLAELYLEETSALLNNIKTCVPFRKNM